MIKIFSMTTGPIGVNTYIVYNQNNNKGFIVDPGGHTDKILSKIKDNNLYIKDILLTHGHFDHCGACAELQRYGMKVYVHQLDAEKLYTDANMSNIVPWYKFEKFYPNELIRDNQTIEIGEIVIKVIHTPGHTRGGVCYVVGDNIFSGDTLFNYSIGRTDLDKDASYTTLISSIKNKLFTLEGDFNVYPGHNSFTTLNDEKNYNPFIR